VPHTVDSDGAAASWVLGDDQRVRLLPLASMAVPEAPALDGCNRFATLYFDRLMLFAATVTAAELPRFLRRLVANERRRGVSALMCEAHLDSPRLLLAFLAAQAARGPRGMEGAVVLIERLDALLTADRDGAVAASCRWDGSDATVHSGLPVPAAG
jgi:hypothetical protein